MLIIIKKPKSLKDKVIEKIEREQMVWLVYWAVPLKDGYYRKTGLQYMKSKVQVHLQK